MITGTFSIVRQSISLGCFPRVTVKHTSAGVEGARAGRRPYPGGGRRRERVALALRLSAGCVTRRLAAAASPCTFGRQAASGRKRPGLGAAAIAWLDQNARRTRGPDCRRLA